MSLVRSGFWVASLVTLLGCRSQLKTAEPAICASPFVSCPNSAVCVDVLNDPMNCGACQSVCAADTTCVQGGCQPLCPLGFSRCGVDGGPLVCADLERDARNCGACGKACAPWEVCRASRCALTCADKQSLCSGVDGRFCADLQSDNQNCGACGRACAAGKVCHQGSCDDCTVTVNFAERDWVWPLAPLRPMYPSVTVTTSGDFNGDGKLDLAVELGFAQVRMLFGDGTGQFVPGDLLVVKNVPGLNDLKALDIDRDGRLDIVVLARDTSPKLIVLRGKGDGHFEPQTPFPLPYAMSAMTTGDVNGDGLPDLLIVGYANGTGSGSAVAVLVAADGSMRISAQLAVGAVTQPPVIADLDGDGLVDLALVQTRKIQIMRGQGQGEFQTGDVLFEGWENPSVAAGDLNGDGKVDLMVMGWQRTDGGWNTASVGIVDGATGKVREVETEIPASRGELYARDVDGDGDLDLLAVVAGNYGKDVWVMAGKGDGSLTPGPKQEFSATGLSLGDFNGDGMPDLLIEQIPLSVSLARGAGVFAVPSNRLPEVPGVVDVADVDGDGQLDLIATQRSHLSVLRGKGNGSFLDAISRDTKALGYLDRPTFADFDGDGRADGCCGDEGALLKGQSDGTFLPVFGLPSKACRMVELTSRDVDRDGILDLVSFEDGVVCVMGGQMGLRFSPNKSYAAGVSFGYYGVVMGDLDGDRYQDVVTVLKNVNSVVIIYGKADGSFESPVEYQVGPSPTAVALADWNGDGRPDLVVADESGLSTFQNRGKRAWAARLVVNSVVHGQRLLKTDWNGDGFDDLLAMGSLTEGLSVIVSRGDGRFDTTRLDGNWGASDVAISDFNRDGRPDMAIAYADRLSLRVLLQQGASCAR
jgi:hypothetical protein